LKAGIMSRKRKRAVGIVIAVAGVAFIAFNAVAYRHAYAMTHFTAGGVRTAQPEALGLMAKVGVLLLGVDIPRPVSDLSPTALAPDCRELRFPSGDATLAAWYCDRGPESTLIIMFHGYSAEKTSLIPEAQALLAAGHSVMLVDFRGSGGSSESYTTVGVREADDVAAAMRYAETNVTHPATILYGKSMGAASILRAVDRHALRPNGIIIEAVFDRMLTTAGNRFHAMGLPAFPGAQALVFWGGRQWGFDGFAHNPVDFARTVRCPALVMHGAADPRATLVEGQRVYDAIPSPKTFITFPESGHASYIADAPEAWGRAVDALIQQATGGPRK